MKYSRFVRVLCGFVAISAIWFAAAPAAYAAGNSELCNDINDVIKILDCGSEDVVTFQGFQGGGLKAPTGTGLDSTLTRAQTARQFIVNTVNFALSFLGVIAMVIIIYGGFLYVTAAGNEDQSGKGKKAITYAVIGILIIIASFAIVNTLLSFGGGTQTDRNTASTSGRGVGEDGSNIGQQVVYNLGAAEINNSLNDFIAAYKNLSSINSLITKLKAVAGPTDRSENKQYMNQVADIISDIKNSTNAFSKTHSAVQRMLDEYISPIQSLSTKMLNSRYEIAGSGFDPSDSTHTFNDRKDDQGNPLPPERAISSDLKQEVLTKIENGTGLPTGIGNSTVDGYGILAAAKIDYKDAIDSLIGTKPYTERPKTADVHGKLPIVWKIMGPVADEVTAQQSIERGLISEKDLQRAFSGIDPNITVGLLFKDAIEKIDKARALATSPDDTDKLVEAVKSLNRLYIIVKDIKFTYVRIRASVRDGNAPVVVELNGLDSRDPTGRTIADEKYKWDPDGDGEDGVQSGGIGFAPVECSNPQGIGATITCTYNQPGTYVVRLTVPSSDPAHIASGQAFLPITVSPSVARIGLKASVGTLSEDLRKYEKDARGKYNLTIDKTEFHVTTQEAKSTGVTFDATSSKSGSDGDLKTYSWSFGDGSQSEEGQTKNRIEAHKYKREGKFTLRLEVTDNGNRKDRKIMNIVIAALAARIGAKQTISEPDMLLEFDGSLSRSDNGAVNSYKWSILNKEGDDVINFQNVVNIVGDPNGSVLRVRFKQPGNYAVKLEVSDGTGADLTQVPISIRSRKPRANFAVRACPTDCPDPAQPSVVELDGVMSFDPDPGDILTYNWTFKNAIGEKLEPKTGFDLDPADTPLAGKDAKKIRMKFKSIGKFQISMNVNDSHTDPSILQEDIKEKEITIGSVVDAGFGNDINSSMKSVYKLNEGSVKVPFKVWTRNAERIEVDYGDSKSDVWSIKDSPVTQNADGSVVFTFEHEYDKAGAFSTSVEAISEQELGSNLLTKQIYVSAGDNPLAAIIASVDGHPATLPKPTEEDPTPPYETIRNKIVKFDGSESINSRGIPGADGLKFSWDFGDGRQSTGAIVQHSYSDVSPDGEPYTVTLTVTERDGDKKMSSATFPIRILSAKPFANTLSIEKKSAGELTPIDVELTAEGASDPDGKITNYQFWYYDPADKDQKFAVVDTNENHTTLTVETNGEENEEHEYYFCVRLTDNDNQSMECSDLFSDENLPKLKVKNGPNKAPFAELNPDRTAVKINDSVTFTSSSKDPDGRIVSYVWDVDGDGFQNDKPTELSSVSHTYTKKSPQGGYRVKLKVIDDKGAAGYSKETPILVLTNSNPPVAGFTFKVDPSEPRRVQFFDTSKADKVNTAKLTKWTWDFDTAVEYGCDKTPKPASCNGNKTDDTDSTDQNPTFDYPTSGTHQVKLTVEDSGGNTTDTTAIVSVVGGTAGGSGGQDPNANVLKAELKTEPAFTIETIGGQKKKIIHVPAGSNGENVTLFWGDSRGNIQRYEIDKNIYCDSSDDKPYNIRDNDTDNPDPSGGSCKVPGTGETQDQCWTTNYQRYAKTGSPFGLGHFTSRLKVIDVAGKTGLDTVEVVFDGEIDPGKVLRNNDCDGQPKKQPFGASLIEVIGIQGVVLISLLAGIGLILIIWGTVNTLRSGKQRNV